MDSRLRGNDIIGHGNDIFHPHPSLSPQGRGKIKMGIIHKEK